MPSLLTPTQLSEAITQLFPQAKISDNKHFAALQAATDILATDSIRYNAESDSYFVRSATQGDTQYEVHLGLCSCPFFHYNGIYFGQSKYCKHTLAVSLYAYFKNQEHNKEATDPMGLNLRHTGATPPIAPPPTRSTLPANLPQTTTQTPEQPTAAPQATSPAMAAVQALTERMDAFMEEQRRRNDIQEAALNYLIEFFQNGVPNLPVAATPNYASTVQLATMPTEGEYITLQATKLSKGTDNRTGKVIVRAHAGRFQQFGIPVYEEYCPNLGINFADLPFGETPWHESIVVQMGKNGSPARVYGLAAAFEDAPAQE